MKDSPGLVFDELILGKRRVAFLWRRETQPAFWGAGDFSAGWTD